MREVSTEISYIGGNESLRKYQDSLYWENYNGDEQNASCLYTILFDRKLKIREIKIVKRAGYNNSKYNYDKLIKKYSYPLKEVGKKRIMHFLKNGILYLDVS